MGFSGLALWQVGTNSTRFEIELDTDSHEVRLTRMIQGRMRPVLRCRFGDLGRVEVNGDMLRIWDGDERFLAEVEMCDSAARERLISAIRSAGHI
jgi:hypothetical protein